MCSAMTIIEVMCAGYDEMFDFDTTWVTNTCHHKIAAHTIIKCIKWIHPIL